MQTIHITIRGDDLSDLEIRKKPPRKAQENKADTATTLHDPIYRNEVNQREQPGRTDARSGKAV
jgi:hypothetical protein